MSVRDLSPWNRGRKLLTPEQEIHPFEALQMRMDRLFDDFAAGFGLAPAGRPVSDAILMPRLDVSVADHEYRISVELPGIDEKYVDVTLSNNVLTIKGEKKAEIREEKDQALRTERSYGSFQRSFSLPADIDEEKVDASFSKGVLTVTIAKSETAQSATRRIEVRST